MKLKPFEMRLSGCLGGILMGILGGLGGMGSEADAGPSVRHGLRSPTEQHDLHHGMGRAGPGICPQERNTAHAPEALYHKENPLKPTQENLLAGKSLYQTDAHPTACKICHGVFGNGLGMMAVGQNPAPRNFLCSKTMKDIPDGQMFWIIKKGSPGTKMPAYKNLSDRQVWQIVLYLRQLAHEAEVRRNR